MLDKTAIEEYGAIRQIGIIGEDDPAITDIVEKNDMWLFAAKIVVAGKRDTVSQ